MKSKFKLFAMSVALLAGATAFAVPAQAQTQKSKSSLASTLGNMLQGVFTKSDLEVADLVGSYESSGPAVTFKGEGFLKKAGGLAGAAALETKLEPYYQQYGLVGMPFTVEDDGSFTLKVGRIGLKGVLEKNDKEKGTFIFNIMLGSMRIGRFIAYVEKTGKNLNLMFDATKLKELISTIGSFSGIKMAKTLASLLDSYDGACIGFKMDYKGGGNAAGETGTSVRSDSSVNNVRSGIGNLLDRLNKKK